MRGRDGKKLLHLHPLKHDPSQEVSSPLTMATPTCLSWCWSHFSYPVLRTKYHFSQGGSTDEPRQTSPNGVLVFNCLVELLATQKTFLTSVGDCPEQSLHSTDSEFERPKTQIVKAAAPAWCPKSLAAWAFRGHGDSLNLQLITVTQSCHSPELDTSWFRTLDFCPVFPTCFNFYSKRHSPEVSVTPSPSPEPPPRCLVLCFFWGWTGFNLNSAHVLWCV